MARASITLVTLLLLHPLPVAAADAAAPANAPEERPAPDDDAPPPGSAADQALWRRATLANAQVPASRAEATRLQLRARGYALDTRLEALARAGDGAAARRLEQLRRSWAAVIELLTTPWPVDPTRACQYELLHFDSALRGGDRTTPRSLAQAREGLLPCLTRAEQAIRAMSHANHELGEEIVRADELLLATPSAPAPQAAAEAVPEGAP